MEKFAYGLLGFVAVCWVVALVVGMVAAFPFGLIGLVGIVGFGMLFIKVLNERLANKDDDYYSKHVDQ